MLVSGKRGKLEYVLVRGKTSQSRVENQQTQPTYDRKSWNRPRATLLEGEFSHHCANPARTNKPLQCNGVHIPCQTDTRQHYLYQKDLRGHHQTHRHLSSEGLHPTGIHKH